MDGRGGGGAGGDIDCGARQGAGGEGYEGLGETEAEEPLPAHRRPAHSPPPPSFYTPLDLAAELKLPRYKLVSYVVIGENLGQGIRVASRCLWDATTDNYASINFKSDALFAAAMLFAAYCE